MFKYPMVLYSCKSYQEVIIPLFDTFRTFFSIKGVRFTGQMSSASLWAFKMCLLLKYRIEIKPTVCFTSLDFASGAKNTQGIISTFDNANRKYQFYRKFNSIMARLSTCTRNRKSYDYKNMTTCDNMYFMINFNKNFQ